MDYILFNPLSGSNCHDSKAKEVIEKLKIENPIMNSLIGLDYNEFLSNLNSDDRVIICGGDGTLNKTANILYNKELKCPFYLYGSGTGNDFIKDVESRFENGLVYLNDLICKLPRVIIDGKETRFINGIGFGIDGEACRVADEKIAKGEHNINYTSISINLLLFHFKAPVATVEVDNEKFIFKNVWIASAMKGKYYGGGMKIAPFQDRTSGKVTFTCFSGKSRIGTLMKFPKIFKGEHIKYKKHFYMMEGNRIKVTFSHPCALQIDGETVLNVTSYEVFAE